MEEEAPSNAIESHLPSTVGDVDNESLHTSEEDAGTNQSHSPPTELDEECLSPKSLEQIWAWNTPVPPALRTCMHDLIAQQAAKEPNKSAVDSWDGQLTYSQVDDKSSRLASHLLSIGVGSGINVPVCFEKSRWTVVAVLAVMKAGGTFALMDPSQPEGRLRTIVEQTGASHIITSQIQEALGRRIAPHATAVVVSEAHFDTYDAGSSLPVVDPSTNLYIQFTSGSTGKPKGVLVTHENYTSGAVPRADLVGYRQHSRVLDFASYAFDVCIDCMLCTLSCGGCLCIASDADRINDLSGAIRRMNVNMAHMTPSVARVLDSDIIPSLDVLGLGGEAVSNGDAAKWGSTTKVVNAYGPSECTVGCTINNQVGRNGTKQVTIGKGVGGSTWIVDPTDHNLLVSPGAVGELLIEGPIVGPGYLGDAEKTDTVFINDPDFLVAGCKDYPGRKGRLYRTGDLVKYDVDGSIIFIGRGDQQVKLRGQRIELAEIEHHMRDKLPAETRVAAEVIRPGGASGEPTLVAFISEKAGLVSAADSLLATFSPAIKGALKDMNRSLSEYLPIYMVPAAYIPLHTMPLLVSAKTDRKQLREIGSTLTRRELAGYAAAVVQRREPSTDEEKQLASLWAIVLGPDSDVSANDNFFAVGGDSLRAMKLVAAARAQGLALSVADIFSNPTLADMALAIKPAAAQADLTVAPFSLLGSSWTPEAAMAETASFCELGPEMIEDVYPCTPLQEGLMALSAKVTEAYVAQRVVEMPDVAAARKLAKAFEVASQDCPILRTRIVQVAGQGLMQVIVKDTFSCPLFYGQSLADYLATDRNDAVDLGKPLVRYAIVANEKNTGKTHFVLTMHHALYDGWSMPLVVERVNRAFNDLTTERPAGVKNFIKYLEDMDRKVSEGYWRERLNGAGGEQFPALPYTGYQQKADSLLEHYVEVDSRAGVTTLATAIRGAWALLVGLYTASNDVVFGETLTGRNAPIFGVEEIEGPMIATVPVRVGINPDSTVGEYLQEIHQQSVLGIPHEHFGLQHIRRLSPDAREACELRTGLVMHPTTDDAVVKISDDQPANGFVPASDDEAAQEALKFNTYALMLVCSLDPKGFLIMASFDQKTVTSSQLQRMLAQLGRLTQQFYASPEKRLGDLQVVCDQEIPDLARLSRFTGGCNVCSFVVPAGVEVTDAWIVDPKNPNRLLPVGATGELLVHCLGDPQIEPIPSPTWLAGTLVEKVYRTGRLAKYNEEGSVVLVEKAIKEIKTKPVENRPARVQVTSTKQIKLRHAWSRILGISEEEIGLNDSFFQLGGDSIGAMKLVSETRVEGFALTVAQIFKHRTLYDMADVLKEVQVQRTNVAEQLPKPFSLLDVGDAEAFVAKTIQPALARSDWVVQDIYPARPLQEVAVNGTYKMPRYSSRYELFHLDGVVDRARLFQCCQELVARNEILRTVFVEHEGRCLGVVLQSLVAAIEEYDIEGDLDSFTHKLCNVDVQTRMPLGSPFVKFLFVQGENNKSCLLTRISHAQYDEICLVGLLRQLGALYDGTPTRDGVPFSSFVYHTVNKGIPQSIPYWRDLLKGSQLSVLKPDIPLQSRVPDAVTRTVSIAARPSDITVATLPTAAWALCLARRLGSRDVVFGEVVSGRNTDLPNADAVMGPTWQYVPVRVQFEPDWTNLDLLEHIQYQHIASAQHQGMSLSEMVPICTDWPKETDWFDSVVHQDVYHVEELKMAGAKARMETVYPHYEPLREWKCQAFVDLEKGELMFEIVTFGEWISVAKELLDELEGIMGELVGKTGEKVFKE
ncbi:surfactin synthetase subunit 3 [Pseudomassariella vexata]|uniref:Surfactin synthetase subunit 3 n=1 Tax=Pseudomassariella vexata TaxID=1141098 RepID=A0A1Y2EI22_9PEZI|nr:surfactin synthetase subunit 3 [Pseudomassariella vexata]ORY70445.1 surfactin synthetase subunit 3 [Pseudomassariella vexata]